MLKGFSVLTQQQEAKAVEEGTTRVLRTINALTSARTMVLGIAKAAPLAGGYILRRLKVCNAFCHRRPPIIQSHMVFDVLFLLASLWPLC